VAAGGVSRLDDEDYPAVTMGQAAELLDVQPAFLRSLDAAGVLHPSRSVGGIAAIHGDSWSSLPGCGRCLTKV
jgi:hypothetical protein